MTTRENGKLRDTVDILTDLGRVFKGQRYEIAYQYAQALGLDEKTFQLLRDQPDALRRYRDEYERTTKALGTNTKEMTEQGKALSQSWRSFLSVMEALSERIAATFFPIITKLLDYMREWVVTHGPQINAFWTQVGQGIEVVERAAKSAYDTVEPFVTLIAKKLSDGFNATGGAAETLKEMKQLFSDIGDMVKRAYEYIVKLIQLVGLDKVAAALGTGIKGGFRLDDFTGPGGMPDLSGGGVPGAGGVAGGAGGIPPGATGKGALAPFKRGFFGRLKDKIVGPRPSIRRGYQAGGGGTASIGKAAQSANARVIIDELRAAGYNDNAVAAIIGSMQTESSLNPRARNEVSGGHTGFWQWDKNRWPRVEKWIRSQNGDPYDARWQTKAWIAEHNAKPGDPMYDHPRTARGGAILRNNPSIDDAIHGVRESERFGVGEEGGRGAKARAWLPHLDTAGRQAPPRPVGQATNVSDAQVIANDHGHYARLSKALGGMDFTARHGATDAPLGVTNNTTNSADRSLNMPMSVTMNVQSNGSPQETANAALRGLTRFQEMSLRNAQGAIR